MTFDAFVSYSHAADGNLAPALQRGLQRLARPWYRVRASAIFRDETGLAVSPQLWASIVRALDDSEWFIVLCSPEAAGSEWVEREITHWLAHKSPDRILLVLTDGDLAWDNTRGDFERERSTALPPALFGRFGDEPRHLDLRWARGEEQLDVRHVRFRTAVAELAAPIRSMAREELEAEDVRQHRRTMLLARGATSVLMLLLILALVLGGIAWQQRGVAQHQTAIARREAVAAQQAATGMLGRGLAAESLNALHDGQPDLAQLLALEAYRTEPSVYSRGSLLQAVMDEPALAVQLHGLANGPDTIALSADGALVAAESGNDVRLWDRRSGQLVARQPKGLGGGLLAFADHGRLLLSGSYDVQARLRVWDIPRGRLLESVPVQFSWAASADASTLADIDAFGVVSLRDLGTGRALGSINTGRAGSVALSPDGTTVAAATATATPDGHAVTVVRAWSVATAREIGRGCSATAAVASLGPTVPAVTPTVLPDDGTVEFVNTNPVAARATPGEVVVCNPRTGAVTSRTFTLSGDQQVGGLDAEAGVVALRSSDGTIQLDDATSGSPVGAPIAAPLTERMSLATVVFSADGKWFTATGSGGDVRVWRTQPGLPLGQRLELGSQSGAFDDFVQAPNGSVVGVTQGGDIVDATTGGSLGHMPPSIAHALSPDGHLLAGSGASGLSLVDLRRHTTVTFPAARLACPQADAIGIAPDDKLVTLSCGLNGRELIQAVDISSQPWRPQPAIVTPVWAQLLAFSPNGRILAAGKGAGAGSGVQLFDVVDSRLRPRATLAGYGDDVVFTPDGRTLVWSHDGRIDLASLDQPGARVTAFAPPTGNPSANIALSPDGSVLAASDGSRIRLWDMSTKQVLGDIPGSSDSVCCTPVAVTAGSITAVGSPGTATALTNALFLVRFDLDPTQLGRRACTRANRNLTRAEWSQYVGPIAYHKQCAGVP